MKIAIFSDLHLGIKSDSVEWHNIALDWIDSIIPVLEKNKIKDIFFLGDWYHNRSAINVLTSHISSCILQKLKDFNLHIFSGNHDLFYSNQADVSSLTSFSGWNNVNYYDKITKIDIGGKTITLCPWGFDPLEDSIETSDYLFGHFELCGFKMNSSENAVCDHGMSMSKLLKKFNKIFSGHFHTAQKTVYSIGFVQYIGSPFQQNFGEADENKGFIILDLSNDSYSYSFNKTSPKFIKITLSKLIKKSINEVNSLFKNNFIRISVDKNITISDMNELVTLMTNSKLRGIEVDWDNSALLSNSGIKTDLKGLELIDTIREFTKLLDIDNKEEVLKYIGEKYKLVSNN